MDNFYKNKTVLITGLSGFKGAWLAQILLNWGAKVIGVSLEPDTEPSLFKILHLEEKVKNYYLDIRDLEGLKQIFDKEKPEIVFHLAAQPIVRVSYDDPIDTITTNVMGTSNLLQVVKESQGVKSVVIITTDKVYRDDGLGVPHGESDPLGGYDPYSSSKAASDIITQSYIKSFFNPSDFNIKHSTLVGVARAGNVIGGGDWAQYRLVPDVVRSVYESNTPIVIRSPKAVRPWQHVLEPLSGYLTLAKKLFDGASEFSGVWNFGPNDDSFVCVEDLINDSFVVLGKGEMVIEYDESKHETKVLKLNIEKAKSELSWFPKLSFKENLQLTFDWYKIYYEKSDNIVELTNKQINSFFDTV